MIATGLEVLKRDLDLQKEFKGKVALLAHNASIDNNCTHAVILFKRIFGARFIKLFGPQHGFSTDVQDNMVETDHTIHPYLGIPVYSLYSETRIPTDEMLDGIDHLFIDLQDIGCRMYTYIYTMTLLLDKCAKREIEIIILDRPNPINGVTIEGNILDMNFESFIGLHPLPVRHGLTMGEVALMHQKYWSPATSQVRVIKMQNWERQMYFKDTKLPWALPSPNIARPESALTFPGTVLFEGTQLSEGRGTTQALEIIGDPSIQPYKIYDQHLHKALEDSQLKGVVIRPITYLPTFQKHKDDPCGGFQIHVTDYNKFTPWKLGQFLLKELYHLMGDNFKWRKPPYEYDYDSEPIDIINGTDKLRKWIVDKGSMEELRSFEDHETFTQQKAEVALY